MKSDDSGLESHQVVSHEEWLAARTALLAEVTVAMSRSLQWMPWRLRL
jgi:predicted dithiol-disulfide oxidoreductase (DUF899 family)